MKNIGLMILAVLVLSACSSAPKDVATPVSAVVPDWVNNPHAHYPEARYLSAVGAGDTRDAAIADAKKQLAESFIVKVNSETTAHGQSDLGENTDGKVAGTSNQNVSKNLSLQSDTYLRGAEIKDVAHVGNDYYASVAVDKLQARSGLLLEANRLKGKIEQEMDSLDQLYTNEKMNDAKNDLKAIQELYGEASALGMSALIDVTPLEVRMNKIQNASRLKNAKTIFAVKMNDEGEQYFEHDIQSCINDRGGVVYTYDKAPANANKVELKVVERPQHMQINGWEKIRFELTAAVTQDNGKMYRVQVNQTETGRSRDAILETVADKLSRDFCENLFNRMSEARE